MYIDPFVLFFLTIVLMIVIIAFLVLSHYQKRRPRRKTPSNQVPEGRDGEKKAESVVLEVSPKDEDAVKSVLIQRIDGIKNRDPRSIAGIVDRGSYTKFDDWPPLKRQDLSALKREKQGLKVLREYDYKTSDWKISVFEGSALASFTINYRGKIRDLEFNIRSRVTAFLVKRDSGWKLVHEHWSRFPEKQVTSLQ